MQGSSTLMSGCTRKGLSCTEGGFTSGTTPNFVIAGGMCIIEHVWHRHGLLEEVISDHRPTFISNFSCELAVLLGVKLTPSTSYHQQTDGQMECINQEIEAYLRVFMSH